jgi:phage gpG-like protein
VSAELDAYVARLRALAQVPEKMMPEAAKAVRDAVRFEFDGGVDPLGKTWAPLKLTGRPSFLTKSTDLRKSLTVEAGGLTINVELQDWKAHFHQYGTSRMVARRMLPAGDDLPPKWRSDIGAVFSDAVRVTLKK